MNIHAKGEVLWDDEYENMKEPNYTWFYNGGQYHLLTHTEEYWQTNRSERGHYRQTIKYIYYSFCERAARAVPSYSGAGYPPGSKVCKICKAYCLGLLYKAPPKKKIGARWKKKPEKQEIPWFDS